MADCYLDCTVCISIPYSGSSGISRSLESVVSGHRPRSQTVATVKADQHGRLTHFVMAAHSVVMQQDPRRFSEASIVPPPRPPPPNLKRMNVKSQRRPVAHPVPPTMWPPQVVPAQAAQAQPQPPPLHQSTGGSNLVRMTHMARSTPQLDDFTDSRERSREQGKTHVQNTRDSLISQVRHRMILVFLLIKSCDTTDYNTSSLASGYGGSAWRDH